MMMSGDYWERVSLSAIKRSKRLVVKINPYPSFAKLEAIAAPNPDDAPVISAYLTIDTFYLM